MAMTTTEVHALNARKQRWYIFSSISELKRGIFLYTHSIPMLTERITVWALVPPPTNAHCYSILSACCMPYSLLCNSLSCTPLKAKCTFLLYNKAILETWLSYNMLSKEVCVHTKTYIPIIAPASEMETGGTVRFLKCATQWLKVHANYGSLCL